MGGEQTHRLARMLSALLIGPALALLSACGGGGGSSKSTSVVATYPPSLASLRDANVVPIAVESGPGNNVNIPYVTVTVCVPNTRQCLTIDHVLLDTGSTGLRLFASQVSPRLTLPAHTIGASSTISECAQFLGTLGWGAIKVADVEIGGERAPMLPIQLMDPNFAPLPDACGLGPVLSTTTDSASNTQALSANGILGVGLFSHDGQIYFNCATPGPSCLMARANYPSPSQQVQNPVALFTSGNNNGALIQLPAVPQGGATSAQGYLVFGVGTQANNGLGAAKLLAVNSSGYFSTLYRGTTYSSSFLDSGSNGLYFADPTPTVLAGNCQLSQTSFYCPASTTNMTATVQLGGSTGTVSFAVANADALLVQSGNYAFNNLGGTLAGPYFDWGLPFFFGRSVFTVMEGRSAPGPGAVLSGPFHAFSN